MKNKHLYHSGTSGLVLPVPNKQSFPPEFRDKPRLTYYSNLFNSLEINSCFYKIPRPITIKKWTEEVSSDFVFTFKLWKGITHLKQLDFSPADVHHFISVINEAGHKKGTLLIQFPPSLTIDAYGKVEQLLQLIPGWKIALEFRHPSWYIAEGYELADEYGASIVLHDMPKSPNMHLNKHASFVYLRFHGPAGDYKGGYTDEQLQHHADQIHTWLKAGKEVFVYFNNTAGDAVQNLLTLNSKI